MSNRTARAEKVERYSAIPSNATAYTLGAVATVSYDHSLVSRAAPLDGYGLQSAMSGKIQIFGQGADGDTILCQVWGGNDVLLQGSTGGKLAYRDLHYYGLITATLSTVAVSTSNPLIVANPAVTAGSLLWADTIVWVPGGIGTTPPGPLTAYEAAAGRGSWTTFSPTTANAGIAELICPHFMNDTVLVLDFKAAAATKSAGAIITTSRP